MVAATHGAEGAARARGLTSGGRANAVLADLCDGNAGVALHDDELAAGIAALAQLGQPLEIVAVPDAGLFRDKLGVREIGRIPMDVIVEQVAVEFGKGTP